VSREIRAFVERGSIQSIGNGRYRIVDVESLKRAAHPV